MRVALHNFRLNASLLLATLCGSVVAPALATETGFGRPDRAIVETIIDRLTWSREGGGSASLEPTGPTGSTGISIAELRELFSDCGPAVDRFEQALLRIVEVVSVAEGSDEVDELLWELTTEFEVVCAAGNLLRAVAKQRNLSAMTLAMDAIEQPLPDSIAASPVGEYLKRYSAAMLKMRATVFADDPAEYLEAVEVSNDDDKFRAMFDGSNEIVTNPFATIHVRQMYTGIYRFAVGCLALDTVPNHAETVHAFIQNALTDFEAAADTFTNPVLRQREENVATALEGRFARLSEEAASRLDEADEDGLVAIPMFRAEDESQWAADLERGLEMKRSPAVEATRSEDED